MAKEKVEAFPPWRSIYSLWCLPSTSGFVASWSAHVGIIRTASPATQWCVLMELRRWIISGMKTRSFENFLTTVVSSRAVRLYNPLLLGADSPNIYQTTVLLNSGVDRK